MRYTVETTTKDKSIGIITTIVFHAILACILLYFTLTVPDPPMSGGEGMVVNLGYVDEATGDIQPMSENQTQPIVTQQQMDKSVEANEKIVTQTMEETEKIATSEKETKNVKEIKETPKVETKPILEEKPVEPIKTVNPATLYKGKNNGATSQGNSNKGNGDQGDPNGDPNSKNYGKNTGKSNNDLGNGNGIGTGTGDGRGTSFSMSGRSAKTLPSPIFNVQESGKVVVEIFIDQNGNVIKAISGVRGSTTTNTTLLAKAKEAALKAKFSPNAEAPEEQRGTIVYNFILK